jgi:hypothetical protein
VTKEDVSKSEAGTEARWEFLSFEEACARALLPDPRLDEAWDLTEAARDLSRPPGPQSSEPVRVCGDQLSWPIFWQGRQWAVTSYGVERRDGTYCVKKDRLWENDEVHSWVHHMAEKNWVDLPDFAEALRVARRHFAEPRKPGAGPTEVGDVFHRRGQRYEVVDVHPHQTRDGRLVPLLRVCSHCADCSEPFEFSATASMIRRGVPLNRRCELHRRPGVPVNPTARRRPRSWRAEPRRAGKSKREERRRA